METRVGRIENDSLGKLIRVHKTSIWNYWWAILLSFLFLFLMFLAWGIIDREQRSHIDAAPVYIVLGVLVVLPILGPVYQLKNEARFYEYGVEYENRRYTKTAHWAKMRDVWEWCIRVNPQGIPMPGQTFYFVRTVDGLIIKFPPRLDDIEELGISLKSEAVKWGVPIRAGVPRAKQNLMNS